VSTCSAMARAKPPYHHGDLRNALVEQAVKLIEEAGAETFSLREAARLVGSPPTPRTGTSSTSRPCSRPWPSRVRHPGAVHPAGHCNRPGTPDRWRTCGRADKGGGARVHGVRRGPPGTASRDARVEAPSGEAVSSDTLVRAAGKALDEMVEEGVLPPNRRPGAELKAWTVVHGFATLVVEGVEVLQKRGPRTQAFEAVLDFAMIGLCGSVE